MYHFMINLCNLDVDECVDGSHMCDSNGNCTNTDGSYICDCHVGYNGDGYNCSSKLQLFYGMVHPKNF